MQDIKCKENLTLISEKFLAGTYSNPEKDDAKEPVQLPKGEIAFFINAGGHTVLSFAGGHYKLPLQEEHYFLLYNPLKTLDLDLIMPAGARVLMLIISIEELHSLLMAKTGEIAFLDNENVNSKYYLEKTYNPGLSVALNQLFSNAIKGAAKNLFNKAKIYEILAMLFVHDEEVDAESCPFLKDESNVEKIRKAKGIITEQFATGLTIPQIAEEIGLNEYKLKEGFKNIYGKTVFQYLNDYRLEVSRQYLDEGSHKVNDAAYAIGYSNPSHFIAAFRKKYGITPKKYLTSKLT